MNPEPVVMFILYVLVVVETGFVVLFSAVDAAVATDEVTAGDVVTAADASFPLKIFSRPMLAMIFSDGVIGKRMKKTRIRTVSATKQTHESIVILVDLFRAFKIPLFFLMKNTLLFDVNLILLQNNQKVNR